MKSIRHIIPVTLALCFMTMLPAQAALYSSGDANFGPDSIIVDTSTGLGWLNLSETSGLSHQQVFSEMAVGGMFNGFRFATVPEVLGLYSSAGISMTGYYPLSTPSISSLFSLIGTSGMINERYGLLATSGTSTDGGASYCAPGIYVVGYNGSEKYWVSDGGFGGSGTRYGSQTSYSFLSGWLVKSVPEPASADFFVLVAAARYGFMLLHRIRNRKS